MLAKFTNIIDKLLVYPENMQKNLDITHGLLYSQPYCLHWQKRDEERRCISHRSAQCDGCVEIEKEFQRNVKSDPEISVFLLTPILMKHLIRKRSLQNVDHIFKRVGLE